MNSAFRAANQSFPLPFGSSDLAEVATPHIDTQSADAVPTESSVTEVVFTRHGCGDNLLLLPMVAYLSQIADRWVSWFTSELPQPSLLLNYGVDVGKIRLIHNRGCPDQRELVGGALSNGTSHTVIASFEGLSRNDTNRLEHCAAKGHSKALIVRYR